jgi:hypothetical protein
MIMDRLAHLACLVLLAASPACSRALSLGEQSRGALGQPTLPDGTCNSSLVACNGVCKDTTSDPIHCGGCDRPCLKGSGTCVASVCQEDPAPDMAQPIGEGCSQEGPKDALCAQSCTRGYEIMNGSVTCTCCTSCPDAADPNVEYVSTSPATCAASLFQCQPGQQRFDNDCGCGCVGGRHVQSGACVRNSGDTCKTDADCKSGGCGGDLCYSPAVSDGITTCDCTTPQGVTCGCVAGHCAWWN